MRSLTLRLSAAVVLLLTLAISCSRPVSTEKFIRSSQVTDSTYMFSVDLFDTLQTWDILFYTAGVKDADKQSLKLDIQWISPAPDTLAEVVYMPFDGSADAVIPYRSGLCPVTPGVHTLSVRVGGAPDGFRGLGVICRTVKH